MATADDISDGEGDAPDAYEKLLEREQKISNIGYARMHLSWDQQVMMPEGGAPARARQLSTLSSLSHELLVDDDVAEWLEALEDADLTEEQAANVREIRRGYERSADVPTELVEEITQVGSENQKIWREAKAEDDFEAFAPRLETVRDLGSERAEYVDPDTPPYEVMYEDAQPYVDLETMDRIFERLREAVPELVAEIRAADADLADPFEGEYDEDVQEDVCREALEFLGYDWDRGRLDTAPHPFMSGTQFDARVTTRFQREDPMDALTATIHEFGHATYQLGLRQDAYATPLGQPRGSGVHESQSRFWENHVGRTEAFWDAFAPTMNEHFEDVDASAREYYEAANQIYPENLIRVEADELTYHMHIILRCEIGRAFVEGEIEVEEIPDLWNEKMDEYLGVTPDTDAEGALQDIHWTSRFAAFHGYTLGSVLAAQLDAAIRDEIGDLEPLIREGEFEPIHEWLTENVHQHGQRYETPELIEKATGEPLTADYFLEYAEDKFGDLYGI